MILSFKNYFNIYTELQLIILSAIHLELIMFPIFLLMEIERAGAGLAIKQNVLAVLKWFC